MVKDDIPENPVPLPVRVVEYYHINIHVQKYLKFPFLFPYYEPGIVKFDREG